MNDESTPKGAHEIPAPASAPIVAALSREFVDGVEYGYQYGVAAGRQQAEDEQRGRGAISAAIAAQMARLGSFADLCEARGELERAARSRQLLADRGI